MNWLDIHTLNFGRMNLGKVLIADDHSFVLNFIRELLNKNFDTDEIVTLNNLPDVNKKLEKDQYDLYVLDLDFKEDNCYELINKIRRLQKDAKIIINTAHWESWHINALLKLCINGIVLKDSCDKYLPEAVTAVMNEDFYLCPNCRTLKYNYAYNAKKTRGIQKEITDKELEILENIANGYTTPKIAERCNISINTVEFHRKNLILKLEAENAPHLVAKAIYYQLIDLKNK